MKTKGWKEFAALGAYARTRSHRATMREAAMMFREQIAPDNALFDTFAIRCQRAADEIKRAVFYRNLAVDSVEQAKRMEAA